MGDDCDYRSGSSRLRARSPFWCDTNAHAIVSAGVTDEIERGNGAVIVSDSFAIDDTRALAQAGQRIDDQRKALSEHGIAAYSNCPRDAAADGGRCGAGGRPDFKPNESSPCRRRGPWGKSSAAIGASNSRLRRRRQGAPSWSKPSIGPDFALQLFSRCVPARGGRPNYFPSPPEGREGGEMGLYLLGSFGRSYIDRKWNL